MNGESLDRAMLRYGRPGVTMPWQAPAPDEVMMAMEEFDKDLDDGFFHRLAAVQELIFAFAFAGGDARCWQAVGLRLVSAMRRLAPSVCMGRSFAEVGGMVTVVPNAGGWPMEELVQAVRGWDVGEGVVRLFEWWFPPEPKEWIRNGVQRVYLLARAYQPTPPGQERLKRGGKETVARDFSYGDLAEIFGEDPGKNPRARWSARAKALIMEPMERVGTRPALRFGKAESTRKKYRNAAMGNTNRKKK